MAKSHTTDTEGSMTVRVLVDSGQCINITCSPSTTGEELRTEAAKIAHYPENQVYLRSIQKGQEAGHRMCEMSEKELRACFFSIKDSMTLADLRVMDNHLLRMHLEEDADVAIRERGGQRREELADPDFTISHEESSLSMGSFSPHLIQPYTSVGRKKGKWTERETWALIYGVEK